VGVNPEPFDQIVFHPDRLDAPLYWRKPKKIFVCSMGDLFHKDIQTHQIYEVFRIMEACPQHTFLVLTKRPERMKQLIAGVVTGWETKHRENIWLGVTAENQEMADKRIPILLQIPAAKKFVSVEPMLGPVDLSYPLNGGPEQNGYGEWVQTFPPLDWVICGPETGPGARFCDWQWAYELAQQCNKAGVPFFDKTKQGLLGKQWPEVK
jgi:protein gp37